MSTLLTEPLRVAHASGLHNVAAALRRLHRERIRAGGDAAAMAQSRVCNLVAACNDKQQAERAARDTSLIGVRHPARAIVVHADAGGAEAISADVSLQCAGGGASRRCTEMIKLEVTGEPAYHLTSIVTPLLVPDVPVYLWILGAPPLEQPFSADVVGMCERILLDSGAYPDGRDVLHTIAAQIQRYGDELWVADLAWERIRPWRTCIAEAFETARARPLLNRVMQATVHGSTAASEALLLRAWLRERLVELPVALQPSTGAPITSALLRCRGGEVEVQLDGDALVSTVRSGDHTRSDRTLLPENDQTTEEAQLITQLIDETDDTRYRAALCIVAGDHGA